MADGLISFTLGTLADLLTQEAQFLSNVKNQVRLLERELRIIQGYLQDVEAKGYYANERASLWVQEIKRLSYQAEDVVEEYATSKIPSTQRSFDVNNTWVKKIFKRFTNLFLCVSFISTHEFGSEIVNIQKGLEILRTSLDTYGIKPVDIDERCSREEEKTLSLMRLTSPEDMDECFVGMEDDFKILLQRLTSDEYKHRRVVSIWGMGGSGKTTIAQRIYNHDQIKRCFKAKAWICVTQQCQRRFIMEETLRQLASLPREEIKSMEDIELEEQLQKVQRRKKCFIVIDDIWKVDDWTSLSRCFPKAGSNSKVLLTTRIKDVAEIGLLYELKPLTEEQGWVLLHKKAFLGRNRIDEAIDPEKERIGKSMIRRCGYLPLAIALLGGILNGKDSVDDWESVYNSIDSLLRQDQGKRRESFVQQVLALSYTDLPSHLKPCFLYLGFLREDEEMDPERLYFLWMAEGMISSKHKEPKETLMDVAEYYLSELAHRSMVQVVKNTSGSGDGLKFRSCRLHDLMRDLCLVRCREEEFMTVVDRASDLHPRLNAYRAVLYVDDNFEEVESSFSWQQKNTQLRSLQVIPRNLTHRWERSIPQLSNIGMFKSLRTLYIHDRILRGQSFDGIKKLVHLRYLAFILCELDTLPLSILELPYLQTLILWSSHIEELPVAICKMPHLRHLFLSSNRRSVRNMKMKLMEMNELETLKGITSAEHDLKDLLGLKNLRVLQATAASLESLTWLIDYLNENGENLKSAQITVNRCDLDQDKMLNILTCRNLHGLVFQSNVRLVMPWKELDVSQLSPSLADIRFDGCTIEGDVMGSVLGRLPNLRTLYLHASFYGEKVVSLFVSGSDFPRLATLTLGGCRGSLKIQKGAMPNLTQLAVGWSCVFQRTCDRW